MATGEIYFDSVEPGFSPTVVGLQGAAVDVARAAGVLVDLTPDLDAAAEQLLSGFEPPARGDS